jgi:hypothetical protein
MVEQVQPLINRLMVNNKLLMELDKVEVLLEDFYGLLMTSISF